MPATNSWMRKAQVRRLMDDAAACGQNARGLPAVALMAIIFLSALVVVDPRLALAVGLIGPPMLVLVLVQLGFWLRTRRGFRSATGLELGRPDHAELFAAYDAIKWAGLRHLVALVLGTLLLGLSLRRVIIEVLPYAML